MKQRYRFAGRAAIYELERIYKETYAGHEADIRFDSFHENTLDFDITVHVPHLLANDKEAEQKLTSALNRCLREMEWECSKIASEMHAAAKAK